jgi:hypothetical protein
MPPRLRERTHGVERKRRRKRRRKCGKWRRRMD